VDPYESVAHNVNLWHPDPDVTRPTIDQFRVMPTSVSLGNAITINFSVSDAVGSGLNRVELWRSNVDGTAADGSWTQLRVTSLSGNGPSSGSFPDTPLAHGDYWYGIHVVDNANNLTDEQMAGLGPLHVTVVCPGDFNGDATRTVQDIFDFLTPWFAHDSRADFNGVGGVTVQDIFDFLAAYFTRCP
jgi:hypothetical protein